ncbi:type II secretion system protein L, partial [Vibrio parahaemolyticus VP2007-007]
SAHSRT